MDAFKILIEFLLDGRHKAFKKIMLGLFVLIAILVVNNSIGFTYFTNTDGKIEQIEKISTLLKDSTLSTDARHELMRIEKETISRVPWMDQIGKKAGRIWQVVAYQDFKGKSPFWTFFSAGFIFWLFGTASLLVLFRDLRLKEKNIFTVAIIVEGIYFLLGYSVTWLLNLIPTLKFPIVNYLIFFVLNILFLLLLARLTSESKKLRQRIDTWHDLKVYLKEEFIVAKKTIETADLPSQNVEQATTSVLAGA